MTSWSTFADNAEQVSHEVCRTVRAAKEIADAGRDFYEAVVLPIIRYVKSKQSDSPHKI